MGDLYWMSPKKYRTHLNAIIKGEDPPGVIMPYATNIVNLTDVDKEEAERLLKDFKE